MLYYIEKISEFYYEKLFGEICKHYKNIAIQQSKAKILNKKKDQ